VFTCQTRPLHGAGGVFWGNSRPDPVQGPPALIPWTGPCLLPPIFNRDPSGVRVGRGPEWGQGQGMLKKTPRPMLLSGAGQGRGPGAPVLLGPVCPTTNSNLTSIQDSSNFDLEESHSGSKSLLSDSPNIRSSHSLSNLPLSPPSCLPRQLIVQVPIMFLLLPWPVTYSPVPPLVIQP